MSPTAHPFTTTSTPVPGRSRTQPELLLFGRRGCPLSNFAAAELTTRCPHCATGLAIATVEHGFQAAKATTCQDFHRLAAIAGAAQVRAAGRALTPIRHDWEHPAPSGRLSIKAEAMLALLRAKFARTPFREILDATGDLILVEDAPWDGYWGAGRDGRGRNGRGRPAADARPRREPRRARRHPRRHPARHPSRTRALTGAAVGRLGTAVGSR